MEVTFTRTSAVGHQTVVRRDDGRAFRVPGAPRPVPHDLAHFAVERALGWQTGFWGYVARGAVFPGMRQVDGRRPPHADERSRAVIAAAKDLLAEAEVLTGNVILIVSGDLEQDGREIAKLVSDSWWPPDSHAQRLPHAEIRRACDALRRATADWQALEVGQRLTLSWSLRRGEHARENPAQSAVRGHARSPFKRRAARR